MIGGMLIGLAATLTLWANGRIAGISGILSGLILPGRSDFGWRALFIAGMLIGPLLLILFTGNVLALDIQTGPVLTIVAGLFVGFGTRLGSGCTSGHGICGIARFSRRSFSATVTFILTAAITVFLTRHVMGLIP